MNEPRHADHEGAVGDHADRAHHHVHGPSASGAVARGLVAGAALVALGASMVVVALTGDSLFYVRDVMTVPLVLGGAVIAALGFASMTGVVTPAHVPRSVSLVVVGVAFVLVVRPGPLSVDAGLRLDPGSGERVRTTFEIPPSSLVGSDASASAIRSKAVELHAGQVNFAAEQFPDVFDQVAIRMVGQFDVDDDGRAVLVRFRINCCAADAVRMSIGLDLPEPLGAGEAGDAAVWSEPGTWVEVWGQWDGDVDDPRLEVAAIGEIPPPDRPYLTLRDI